jgi:Protein of unknown function (DUF3617)
MIRMLPFASLVLLAAALPAQAEEIHGGNWEFTTQTQIAGMPQLPPGVTLPPGVKLPPSAGVGPGGVVNTHTGCISAEKPIPTDPKHDCTIEKNDRYGSTVNWAATCNTPRGQAHAEGVATYRGDTMDSTVNMHITGNGGQSMDVTTHTTGRYLGACPG